MPKPDARPVVQPRVLDKFVPANPKFYREGTELRGVPVCFPVNEGGLGDFISWIPALQWVAEECPHVHGHLLVHGFLLDLAKHFFDRYEHWKVGHIGTDWQKIPGDMMILGFPPGDNPSIFNAMSSRLSIPGWAYFVNTIDIPPGWDVYPDLTGVPEVPEKMKPEVPYVILTPGATALTRTVPGHYWNGVVEWILNEGMEPVVLGRSHLTEGLPVTFTDGFPYEKCYDLRDKTTTLEAAALMRNAFATVGLDNGLLHLAACTGGNVIFGYNITSVESRRPRMRGGRLIEVALSREELACIGCMTNMKLTMPHDFRFCLYTKKDAEASVKLGLPPPRAPKCVEMLFAQDAQIWIDALEVLKKPRDAGGENNVP